MKKVLDCCAIKQFTQELATSPAEDDGLLQGCTTWRLQEGGTTIHLSIQSA